MSDIFTIVLFSAILFLFLFITYGTGALDPYFKGYRVYSDTFDKPTMASDSPIEEGDLDGSLHRSWRGEDAQQIQFLYGCQGLKQRRRLSAYGTD